MSFLKPFMVKRGIFMLCTMLPVLIYAEYTHRNTVVLAAVAAAVCSGVSVVLFPDPSFLEEKNKQKNQKKADGKKDN